MANATVEIQGADQLRKALARFGEEAEKRAINVINATASSLRGRMIKKISTVSKGAEYTEVFRTIGGRVIPVGSRADEPNLGPRHTASAPGDAPNTDTGNLVKNIGVDLARSKPEAFVFSRAEYTSHLEFGTRNMAERPFMRPSADEEGPEFVKRIQKVISDLTKRPKLS